MIDVILPFRSDKSYIQWDNGRHGVHFSRSRIIPDITASYGFAIEHVISIYEYDILDFKKYFDL